MCPKPQKRPQARKSQADRTEEALTALRKAALELIVSDGINNLKLADVGTRAGYSRGIVHYHFGTKNDLLIDLLEDSAAIGEEIYAQEKTSGLASIENVFDHTCEMFKREPEKILGLLLLVSEATCSADPNLRARVTEYNRVARKHMETAIDKVAGKKTTEGGLSSKDQALILLGLIRGACSQWLVERESIDIVRVLQLMKSRIPAILELP